MLLILDFVYQRFNSGSQILLDNHFVQVSLNDLYTFLSILVCLLDVEVLVWDGHEDTHTGSECHGLDQE